jgi:hypothetical protein
MNKTQAIREGNTAYATGETPHCPYPRSRLDSTQDNNSFRIAWYDGYYGARIAERLPKWFTVVGGLLVERGV